MTELQGQTGLMQSQQNLSINPNGFDAFLALASRRRSEFPESGHSDQAQHPESNPVIRCARS